MDETEQVKQNRLFWYSSEFLEFLNKSLGRQPSSKDQKAQIDSLMNVFSGCSELNREADTFNIHWQPAKLSITHLSLGTNDKKEPTLSVDRVLGTSTNISKDLDRVSNFRFEKDSVVFEDQEGNVVGVDKLGKVKTEKDGEYV